MKFGPFPLTVSDVAKYRNGWDRAKNVNQKVRPRESSKMPNFARSTSMATNLLSTSMQHRSGSVAVDGTGAYFGAGAVMTDLLFSARSDDLLLMDVSVVLARAAVFLPPIPL